MKKRSIIIASAAVVLVALLWVPVSRSISWRHDYAEAESLQSLVWSMAGEMERFKEIHGTAPASIEEIARFSSLFDFSRLGKYRPEFTPSGDRLFYLRVNQRFSFQIDKKFTPSWADFPGIFDEPRDRSAGNTTYLLILLLPSDEVLPV